MLHMCVAMEIPPCCFPFPLQTHSNKLPESLLKAFISEPSDRPRVYATLPQGPIKEQ